MAALWPGAASAGESAIDAGCPAALAEALGPDGAQGSASLRFGMDLSFWDVNTEHLAKCSRGGPRNHTIRGYVFLPRYDDGEVRQAVKERLAQMRRSGFAALRTHLFFGPGRARDHFELGVDGAKAASALQLFAADVAGAGFEHLHVVFSVQGTASPACRGKRWGECFDPQTTGTVIDFIREVRRALAPPPALQLSFDLAPEKCATETLPSPLQENLVSYVRQVVEAYTASFPDDATTVSCGIRRFSGARDMIDEAYARAGGRPAFYEVHAYRSKKDSLADLVAGVRSSLAGAALPLVIGETHYGDGPLVEDLVRDLQAAGGGLQAIYFWPLSTAGFECHVDVPPPYGLRDALAGACAAP